MNLAYCGNLLTAIPPTRTVSRSGRIEVCSKRLDVWHLTIKCPLSCGLKPFPRPNINQSDHLSLRLRAIVTPFQRLTSTKPSVSHLGVFGCRTFFWILVLLAKSGPLARRNASSSDTILTLEGIGTTIVPQEKFSSLKMWNLTNCAFLGGC